jgi:hypothetical protein
MRGRWRAHRDGWLSIPKKAGAWVEQRRSFERLALVWSAARIGYQPDAKNDRTRKSSG